MNLPKISFKELFDSIFTIWLIVVAIHQIILTEYVMSALTFFISGLKIGYKVKELELLIIKHVSMESVEVG